MSAHEEDMTQLVDRLRERLENWAAESTRQAGQIGDLKRWLAEAEAERDALKAELEVQRAIVAEFDQAAAEKAATIERVKAVAASPRSSMGRVNDYVPVANLRAALEETNDG